MFGGVKSSESMRQSQFVLRLQADSDRYMQRKKGAEEMELKERLDHEAYEQEKYKRLLRAKNAGPFKGMMERAERSAELNRERAEKKKREDQASKREVLPHLPVTGNTPGRLMIGRPPANKTIVRTPMKSPPKPKPKPVPSSAPVLRQRGGKGGGGADDDEFATPRRTPSRMMFRKMDPATYVDFYLNGGKHDPPSESLMEEVNRQRNREAGIRRVGHFEGRFKGVMKSPLGGYGRRFHKTVAPLSVEQIAKYREEGRRRPLLLEGGDGGGGYLQGPV